MLNQAYKKSKCRRDRHNAKVTVFDGWIGETVKGKQISVNSFCMYTLVIFNDQRSDYGKIPTPVDFA